MTLTGKRLTKTTAVRFGSNAATGLTVRSDTSVTAKVPSGQGEVDVTVVTSEGTSPVTSAARYTYSDVPITSSSTPRIVGAAGGDVVTITGRNLSAASKVTFGSESADFEVVSSTTIKAVAPAGSGVASIQVSNAAGTSAVVTSARAIYTTENELYQYNGDGLRVAVTDSNGDKRTTVWDRFSGLPAPIVDGATRYIQGPLSLPLAQVGQDDEPTYFFHDHLGSTRALIGANGALSATFDYTPYGQVAARTGTATTAIGYAGGIADAATGLSYLLNRYYDTQTGQFLTVDPALALTGQPYEYASSNPTNATDPTGQFGPIVFGLIVGGIVGGVAGGISYAIENHDNLDFRGALGAVGGGAAGGAITGACVGATAGLAIAACGAAGGVVSGAIERGFDENERVFDGNQIVEDAVIGGVSGYLAGGRLAPRFLDINRGWLNGTIRPGWSQLAQPGRMVRLIYGNAIYGEFLEAITEYALGSEPVC